MSEQELAHVRQQIASKDPDVIRRLRNGELEAMVNAVLRFEVKPENAATVRGVLGAAMYGPRYLREKGRDKEFHAFLQDEVRREHTQPSVELLKEGTIAGRVLFDMIQEYRGRLEKGYGEAVHGHDAAERSLRELKEIFSIVEHELNDVEKRAVAAVITYLEAKHMAVKR